MRQRAAGETGENGMRVTEGERGAIVGDSGELSKEDGRVYNLK